jgi:CHASE2 domain-containing sensor protein
MLEAAAPRVFISYSHDNPEHCDRVLELADRLRVDGIDASIDQYVQFPPEGWPVWCEAGIEKADFVLMVCTETYFRRVDRKEEPGKGHGVLWEVRLIRQLLYDAGSVSAKFVPVLVVGGLPKHVPAPVRGGTIHRIDTPEGYEALLRVLTDQPLTPAPPIGQRKELPPRPRQTNGTREKLSVPARSLRYPEVEETFVGRLAEPAACASGSFPGGGVAGTVAVPGMTEAGTSSLADRPSRESGAPLRIRDWNRAAGVLRNAGAKALIGAHVIVVLVILVRPTVLQPIEWAIYDKLRVAWAGDHNSNRILLVGASEEDIARWHWPLTDGILADLLERLASWKPRVIGVDLYRDSFIGPDTGTNHLKAVLAQHPEIFWCFKLKGENSPRGVPAPEPLRGSGRAVLADVLIDPGNIVRRGLLYADDGIVQYTGLGAVLALGYLRPDGIEIGPEPPDSPTSQLLRLGKTVISPLDGTRGPYLELDARGYQLLLDYRGGPDPFQRVSLSEVMDRDDVGKLVSDRAVIIGAAADSLRDVFTTPFSSWFTSVPPIFGIQIHGYLADQLIREARDGDPSLKELSRYRGEMIWIWGWAVGGALIGIASRRTLPTLGALFTGPAALLVIVYLAFGKAVLLPFVPAALAWVCAALFAHQVARGKSNGSRVRVRRRGKRLSAADSGGPGG